MSTTTPLLGTVAHPDALFPVTQLGRRYPDLGQHRGGASLAPSTGIRWARKGVIAADGTRVRLRAVRTGACWSTSHRWLIEFLERLGQPAEAMPNETDTRRAQIDTAADSLRRQGLI
jgi:hypothetical protein